MAMKFAPINVRPCQILSSEGSHHDGGVQKALLPAPAGHCVKLRNGLRASVRRSGAGMSVLDGEAVPR